MSYTYSVCPKCQSVNKVSFEKAKSHQAVCGKCQGNLKLHGFVSEVTTNTFKKILKISDRPVIVDFWASWCGPCKQYGPEFEKASTENTNAVFLKVSTETESMLSQELGIRGIPCTIIYKNEKEVKRQAGLMTSDQIKSLLQGL